MVGESCKANLPFRSTRVGAHNDAVFDIEIFTDPTQRTWLRVQIIDGDVEETLDLTCMQIHGDDMVASRSLQHVRHQLRGDRRSRLVLFVLTGIRKVGNDGRYATCRGCLACVDHDQQFHKAIVDIARGGTLQNEHYIDTNI
jgi:hypothetical protein